MNTTEIITELNEHELENIEAGSWLSNRVMEFCGYLAGVNAAIGMNTPQFGQAYK